MNLEAYQILFKHRTMLESALSTNGNSVGDRSLDSIKEVISAYQLIKQVHVDWGCGACVTNAVVDAGRILHNSKFMTFPKHEKE